MSRLDQALVERGLCDSREKARRAIMAGQATINQRPAHKPSDPVKPQDEVALIAPEKFVSRGGLKLEHALQEFRLDVAGQTVIDLGASTGGFTDCLLQHGAAKVYAVDVGRGQLARKLQQDPRVIVRDGVNARYLDGGVVTTRGSRSNPPCIGERLDLITIDVSFISLTLILPAAYQWLKPRGKIVALIKPQFEAGRAEVGRGGVVRDPAVHRGVVERIREFAQHSLKSRVLGVTESPLRGPAGNREFLICIEKP